LRDRVRLLLLELPPLLHGLLEQAIDAHGRCEMLTRAAESPEDLVEPAAGPDAVIIGLEGADDAALVPALFARWPRAQIVTITPAGHELIHYRVTVERTELGSLSPTELIDVIHELAGGPAGDGRD